MKGKFFTIISMLIIALMLTTGCGTTANNTADTNGSAAETKDSATPVKDTLKIAYSDSLNNLDCNLTSENMSEKMCANIYGTLLRFDENYKPQPYVAKSWEISADGLTCTLKLRDDVKFTDGKKLTSKDVVYSLKKSKESPANGAFLAPVKEFVAVDDYTVNLVLEAPYAPLLNVLCEPLIGLFNEETYTAAGDGFKTAPVSCGPYKVKEWIADTKLVLERNDDFFGEPPAIKTVEIMFIPDATTKTIALKMEK
jgi:peptide/nickel transport system substrate-binding protein